MANETSASGPHPGDPWTMGEVGDCPATSLGHPPLPHVPAFCTLDTGHAGPHVASDGERVVCVWRDAPATS